LPVGISKVAITDEDYGRFLLSGGDREIYCSRYAAIKILFLNSVYEIIKSIKLSLPAKRAAIGVD